MFKNYLKIALRNILKFKGYSAINILGLSLGIGVAILIYLFVSNEFSYDDFHKNKDRIYRLLNNSFESDGTSRGYSVYHPIPFGPDLKNEMPEIKYAVRLSEDDSFIRNKNVVDEEHIVYADRPFFKTFSFKFKYGDRKTSLDEKYSIVISEEKAKKYFGNQNPVGKYLEVLLGEDYISLEVTGVLDEIPANSSLAFDFVLPYDLLNLYEWYRERENSYNSWNSPTYVLLKENADVNQLETKMIAFWDKYMGENFERQRTEGRWKFDYQPIKTKFQPLEDVHHSELRYPGIAKYSDPIYAYILIGIAIGILLIACINFMNLSISKASNRSSEIAVRKVVGASRKNLIYQFWGEAILLSFFAAIIALLFVNIVLPVFNKIIQSNLSLNLLSDWKTLLSIIVITIMSGLIAGSYPAIILSSFKPVQIFGKKFKFGGSNFFTRSLIVLQFSMAVFLIAATIIMSEQLSYLKNKNLGFDKEQVVVIRGNYQKVDATRILNIFKNEFRNDADINMLSGISYAFTRGYDQVGFEDSKGNERRAYVYRVDENFMKLMNLNLIDGRNFDLSYGTDSSDAVIVNQKLLHEYGIKNPLNSRIDGFENRSLDNPKIIGVVQDFNFTSLEEKIEPVILYMSTGSDVYYILAKLSPNRIETGLSKLENKWNELTPNIPFQYSFLDEDLNKQYQETELQQDVINYSAGFAIFISAIGLLGMVSYTTEKRKKEIGIRKVLGASVASILELLSIEFIILVGIANLIALPLVFYVMQNWLQDFAYRIDLSVWIFLSAGLLALFVALFTISFQVIRTARINPVNMIRYE